MVKVVKYTCEVAAGPGAACTDGSPECDMASGLLHVCFEDGSGTTICKSCFEYHLNDGEWTTDSTVELAS